LYRLPDAGVARLRHQGEAEHEAHRGNQDPYLAKNEKPRASTHMVMAMTQVHLAKIR
jgi:hypothetical protein